MSEELDKSQFHVRGSLCRYAEPIEDLRMMYDKKERRILRKQQTYEGFGEKLNVSLLKHLCINVLLQELHF